MGGGRGRIGYTARSGMTTRRQPIRAQHATTIERMAEVTARSRQRREEAAALQAVSRQAQRRASALVEAGNAILDSAIAITVEVLARREIALAQPVGARFLTNERGSTGVELDVRLKDPAEALAAKRAIVERFAGEAHCDRLIVS